MNFLKRHPWILPVLLVLAILVATPPVVGQTYLDFYLTDVDGTSINNPDFQDGGEIGFTATGSNVTADINWGYGANQVEADDVPVTIVTGATYDSVQDFIDIYGSRGIISGGEVTDNGNGTIDIAAGTCWLRTSDAALAPVVFVNFPAKNNLALTDGQLNYIYADYNDGVTILVAATTSFAIIANDTRAIIASAFRDGNDVHFVWLDGLYTDIASKVQLSLFERFSTSRVSGLAISANATYIELTSGVIYAGLQRSTSSGFNTSPGGGDVFTAWYTDDSASTWTKVANQTTVSNTEYNDITTGLELLTGARYGVHWVYVDFDGEDLHVVYGRDNYTAAGADAADPPSILPPLMVDYSVLVGKIIIQKDSATMEALSPFEITFSSSLATDHGSLAGLGDDDHLQYFLTDGSRNAAEMTVTEAGGISVGGTPAADTIAVETSDASDPQFSLKTTNTAHEVVISLDESEADDVVTVTGQTAAVNTMLRVIAQAGEFAFIQLFEGGEHAQLTFGTSGSLALRNLREDGNLLLQINDGNATKTITWNASNDRLEHSAGTFNFWNDNLTTTGNVTGANIFTAGLVDGVDQDQVDRAFQIVGCSLSGDLTNDLTAQERVAFTNATMCVAQFDKTSGDVGTFHFELPPTFGFGGTTTITYHFWAITQTEANGTLVGSLKLATSSAGLASASAVTSTVTFSASDTETQSVESGTVTIWDAGTAAAGDFVIGEFQTTAASTVAEEPFVLVVVGTYKGV